MPKVTKTSVKATEKVEKKTTALSVPLFALDGKETGTLSLPESVFGAKINKELLAQAVKVYTTNARNFTGSTKTRGQVSGTTAKAYSQKGTGRARHGAKTAPIFVGGGVAFGPHPRNVRLDLPKKMKKAALISALSAKTLDNRVLGLTGIDAASGKTSQMATLLQKIAAKENKELKSTLIIVAGKEDKLSKAVGNIARVQVLPFNMINAYEVIKYQVIAVTKEAVEKLVGKDQKEAKESN